MDRSTRDGTKESEHMPQSFLGEEKYKVEICADVPDAEMSAMNTRCDSEVRRSGGEDAAISRPVDWSALLSGSSASEEFMDEVEDLPVQERSAWSGSSD